jgi:hypothetical protein
VNLKKGEKMKTVIVTMIAVIFSVMLISAPQAAHADFYTGGDWGGRDLLLLNGDSLLGNFYNVGQFYIPTGAIISGGTGNLVVNAGSILIDGKLIGTDPGYDLGLSSQTDFLLSGSLSSWNNISLSANQITIDGSLSVLDGTAASSPNGSVIIMSGSNDSSTSNASLIIGGGSLSIGSGAIVSGGSNLILQTPSISVVPTPIPAAALLFGSGLLGLVETRRRMKKA